jgi:hypothetical protein
MNRDVDATELAFAVERMHGGKARLIQPVPVAESFEGPPVVHIFDLTENPKATRAYAWSSPIEGSTKRRFFAVLHTTCTPAKSTSGSLQIGMQAGTWLSATSTGGRGGDERRYLRGGVPVASRRGDPALPG